MSAPTVTLTLTKDDLSTLHGWANFVKFTPGEETWEDEDERVRKIVYDALLPLVRGIPKPHAPRGEIPQ